MLRFLFALLILPELLFGQSGVDVRQTFLDLTHEGVLMDISAHPDDEDGSTLAYYRMKYGVKTYSVLFTRGEGGQNEKGPELYEELGVLRSAETEAAGKILGAEVRFLNLLDFGYSKTATETFRMWGGQMNVLRRLVYMIRKLKPDVIFTNHNTADGHGHHQAVAITAIAAFDAAADSTLFPEQLSEPGITLWQPRKLFFRVFGRSEPTFDVANAIEEVNPARGLAYVDIASNALKMHKTQGLERANLRSFARGKSYYKLMRANSLYDQDSTSFFSGIDLWRDPTISGLKGLRNELSLLHESMRSDSLLAIASRATLDTDSLLGKGNLSSLARRMLDHWREELENLIESTCDVRASLILRDTVVVPRQRVQCVLNVSSSAYALSGVRFHFELPTGWSISESIDVAPELDGHHVQREFTLTVGDRPQLTLPRARAQYSPLEAHEEIGVHLNYALNGYELSRTEKAKFDVAPPELLTVTPRIVKIAPSRLSKGVSFEYTVKNFLPHKVAGRVKVEPPKGWRAETGTFVIDAEDSTAHGRIAVYPSETATVGEYTFQIKVDYWVEEVTVRVFDVTTAPGLKVGIIRSYDTTLETAVRELGMDYTMVDDRDIETGDLSRYQTMVIDIRAYLVREALKKFNNRLLDYVRGGGNLVVMYQREQEWKSEYAPFPFQITRKRVTVEEAPVEILSPGHALMNSPNRISSDDWSGWKQERALYFPGNVPHEYTQLLGTRDPDEPLLTTGYLVATYGKGSYIYTSFVWYRQLKEDNPGAYRCFANMLSYPAYRK